jgi:hypothetical protein
LNPHKIIYTGTKVIMHNNYTCTEEASNEALYSLHCGYTNIIYMCLRTPWAAKALRSI